MIAFENIRSFQPAHPAGTKAGFGESRLRHKIPLGRIAVRKPATAEKARHPEPAPLW
jgi:hypothetical protein